MQQSFVLLKSPRSPCVATTEVGVQRCGVMIRFTERHKFECRVSYAADGTLLNKLRDKKSWQGWGVYVNHVSSVRPVNTSKPKK